MMVFDGGLGIRGGVIVEGIWIVVMALTALERLEMARVGLR